MKMKKPESGTAAGRRQLVRGSAGCKRDGPPDGEKGAGRKWRGEVNVKPHSRSPLATWAWAVECGPLGGGTCSARTAGQCAPVMVPAERTRNANHAAQANAAKYPKAQRREFGPCGNSTAVRATALDGLRYNVLMIAKLTSDLPAALHAAGDGELEVVDPETRRRYVIVDSETHRRAMEELRRQQDQNAIAEGLLQMEAGEGEPLTDAFAKIRNRLGFLPEK